MLVAGRVRLRLYALALLVSLSPAPAAADLPAEEPGRVEKLSSPFDRHWVWVSDLVLERAALIDLDDGRFLGMVNGGYGAIAPLFSSKRSELYLPATYYSRRFRGKRTDVVEIYDIATLSPIAEVEIPPKRAIDRVPLAHSALSDDERFLAVFNWTPGTSLSIVDVQRRAFTDEIMIPGCALVYAAGNRRFFGLCADGAAIVGTVDDEGHEAGRQRTAPFFDPTTDPVTEKAVRWGDQWLFVSFEGWVYPVDVSGPELRFGEKWSLVDDGDRARSWRIGGAQHLAVHEQSGRLFSLVHQGGPDTHKEAGSEVWVYDLETKRRLQRIALRTPGLTVYGFPLEIGSGWIWPFNSLATWMIDTVVPAAVSHIAVTQGEEPRLLTATEFSGAIGVYDGADGRFLDRVLPTGWTTDLLLAPWGG